MHRVLLIEVDEAPRKLLLLGLRGHGIEAQAVASTAAAQPILAAGGIEIVVLALAAGDGLGGLQELMRGVAREAAAISSSSAHSEPGMEANPGLAAPAVRDARVPAGLDVVVAFAFAAEAASDGISAIRLGAADFVSLSEGLDPLAVAIQKIRARQGVQGAGASQTLSAAMTVDRRPPASAVPPPDHRRSAAPALSTLVGGDPKMRALWENIRRLAAVRANVLVWGESGTGKELVARALHEQSPWAAGPFVAVNCGAIPAGLIESELFGHVRGAFTDAVRDRAGVFEAAHGGTLFLDEIADLPLPLQPKLLRVIQEGEIRRVGDVREVSVEVRLVAATARHLASEVSAGRFREDLYYRLSALSLDVPALRERPDDIPLLADYFLARACVRLGIMVDGIADEALAVLRSYPWPGNVRELENTIERAAVMSTSSTIDAASLPERVLEHRRIAMAKADIGGKLGPPPGTSWPDATVDVVAGDQASASGAGRLGDGTGEHAGDLSVKRAVRNVEKRLIRRALQRTNGNRTQAARLLEISQRALLYKIKEYDAEPVGWLDPSKTAVAEPVKGSKSDPDE